MVSTVSGDGSGPCRCGQRGIVSVTAHLRVYSGERERRTDVREAGGVIDQTRLYHHSSPPWGVTETWGSGGRVRILPGHSSGLRAGRPHLPELLEWRTR